MRMRSICPEPEVVRFRVDSLRRGWCAGETDAVGAASVVLRLKARRRCTTERGRGASGNRFCYH